MADNLLYVFVALGTQPRYHIVPSGVVGTTVKKDHADWLARPGRGGRPHEDNTVRKFKDDDTLHMT